MKKEIHPEYKTVVIQDTSSGATFLTASSAKTEETIKWEDGNTYPLIKVEISSASHPFFTGKQTLVDKAGRVERFAARVEASKAKQAAATPKKARKSSSEQ